jgi:hypothetical protein
MIVGDNYGFGQIAVIGDDSVDGVKTWDWLPLEKLGSVFCQVFLRHVS